MIISLKAFALLMVISLLSSSSLLKSVDAVPHQFVPLTNLVESGSSSRSAKNDKSAIPLLPEEFQIGYGPYGLTLMWSSISNIKVHMGGSRPEFRFTSPSTNGNPATASSIFGYPLEISPQQLHLPIKHKDKDLLMTEGMKLEVWRSGQRIDSGRNNLFSTAKQQEDAAVGGEYNSKPPNTPRINVNPAAQGNYTIMRRAYNLRPLIVPSYLAPIEVLGEVTQPLGTTGRKLKSPLVLFLHGRHDVCYTVDGYVENYWPCPEGCLPIPSHKGYRYVSDILASQGYIVVSISANSINAQDFDKADKGVDARSRLIRHHLSLWSTWNRVGGDPWNSSFIERVNMDQVILVGHSRGGEGVHRAAIDASSSDPYKIVGLVSYGPTAFGEQVTPDIHSVTILPTCDGDVSDLQGQLYIDRSRDVAYSEALRSAVIALGANHNYFNTEWTPGLSKAISNDDWPNPSDPVCGDEGALRLTAKEQRDLGAAYTLALVRLAVNKDLTMLPLLDGSFVKPAAIGTAEVAVSAIGGAGYRLLHRPGEGFIRYQNGMTGKTCAGLMFNPPLNPSVPSCGNELDGYFTPHFRTLMPTPLQELRWESKNDARARFDIPGGVANLTKYDSISIRVANDPNNPPVRVELLVQDIRGRNASVALKLSVIDGWPGTEVLDRLHARSLRGQLSSTMLRTKVDLSRITAIFLVSRTASGRVFLFDIAVSQNRIVQPVALNLPVVSVDSLFVQEGDGYSEGTVRVRVNPAPVSPGEVWLLRRSTGEVLQLTIPVGAKVISKFKVSWFGNSVYDETMEKNFDFVLFAVKGVVIGNYVGGYTVVEDDPLPTISAVANNVTVAEGQLLRWTLKLSSNSSGVNYVFNCVPPTKGNELYSNDVEQSWLMSRLFSLPNPPSPMSELRLQINVFFDYGEPTKDIVVPILVDGNTEQMEIVRLDVDNSIFSGKSSQPNLTLIGIVRAN